jgi:hypothetical protein
MPKSAARHGYEATREAAMAAFAQSPLKLGVTLACAVVLVAVAQERRAGLSRMPKL